MIILAIDTSCDETAAAITDGTKILSNVVWSQASLHAKWGGVVPNLAKRAHQERIGFVINKAIQNSKLKIKNLDAVAVTVGPGLAVALEVGIKKAKKLSLTYDKPLIAVDHIEGHILSPLALPRTENSKLKIKNLKFPALGVVASGKHTELVYINKIGDYKILASTIDDALGEALDKAARMLGFGYPGGHIIENLARSASSGQAKYKLPIPLIGQEKRLEFSYSGLKTALYRKIEKINRGDLGDKRDIGREDIYNLAASFQKSAFTHFVRVTEHLLQEGSMGNVKSVLAGGGVMANVTLRKLLRGLFKKNNLPVYFPYSKKLYGDNAGMIGVAAYFKTQRGEFVKRVSKVDRIPNLKVNQKI